MQITTELTTQESIKKLSDYLAQFKKILVAYSGGIDSACMLKVCITVLGNENVHAITTDSPSYSSREKENAINFAQMIGANHTIIQGQEMNDEKYLANSEDRCFYCKTDLYSQMEQFRVAEGYDCIVNGANYDDLGDYRPGHNAAKDFKVHQPFAELGITKHTLRAIARELNVPFWEKPAAPCLASRVPYHQSITEEKLTQIEKAEDLLNTLGFKELRVRHYGNLAKIEVPESEFIKFGDSDLRSYINAQFLQFGFTFVSIDIAGFTSGNLNKDLDL